MNEKVYPLNKALTSDAIKERIAAYNPQLHAVRFSRAPDKTKTIHLLVKDNIGVKDWPTSAGSFALKQLHLPDAFCIKQLRKNSQIDIFGKTHLTELAGFVTQNALPFGYSELGGKGGNPHGAFPCGGSSSGSAIAAAAGFCDAALGTETRGSLMVPAMRNGAFGFKPTRGAVSRSGIIPLSSSLDAPGVLARSAEVLKTVFLSMVGRDPEDSQSFDFVFERSLAKPKKRILFCFDRKNGELQLFQGRLSALLDRLKKNGFEILFIDRPDFCNDYTVITSQEIRRDITNFLRKFGSSSEPENFDELVRRYRERPASHPFGMERLEQALAMEPLEAKELENLVHKNIQGAQNLIKGLLNAYDASFLGFADYVDWFAISGFPSVALPVDFSASPPISIMFGASRGEDLQLLEFAQTLSARKRIAALPVLEVRQI